MRLASVRAGFVILGYIAVFQNASVNSNLKIAFVAITLVIAVVSAFSAIRSMGNSDHAERANGGLLLAAALLGAVIVVASLITLVWSDVSAESWVRDALNYIMFPALIAVGLDLGLHAAPIGILRLTIVVGIVGGLSFASGWLARRGTEGAEFEQLGLASSFICFAGICACLALYFSSERTKPLYLALACVQMGLLLLAGGRSTVIYCAVVFIVALFVSPLRLPTRVSRWLGAVVTALVGFSLLLSLSVAYAGGVTANRFQWFERLFEGGVSTIESDASAIARNRASSWLTETWLEYPVFGQGLGHSFPLISTGTATTANFTLDSPIIVLTKFGVVGALILVIALVLLFRGVYGSAPAVTPGARTARLIAVLAGILTLVLLPNGFPIENRGFSIMVLLVVALAVSFRREDRKLESLLGQPRFARPARSRQPDAAPSGSPQTSRVGSTRTSRVGSTRASRVGSTRASSRRLPPT